MTRTFLDAGVLIAAVRGQEDLAARVLALLEAPERTFLTSDFLRMTGNLANLFWATPWRRDFSWLSTSNVGNRPV